MELSSASATSSDVTMKPMRFI